MTVPRRVVALAAACAAAGGRAWLVGGCVRDDLRGEPVKDIDVEVHGLSAEDLVHALRRVGHARQVGRSFSVWKLRDGSGDIDVALPRGDLPAAPEAALMEALRHRDLTVNALARDPLSGALVDPYGGQQDLADRRLREVDPRTFLDDPVRALRAVQLASRLGFTLAPSLVALCRQAPLQGTPSERIWIEVEKWLLRSPAPSVGLRLGQQTGVWGQVLPEVAALDPDAASAALDRAATRRDTLPEPRGLALLLGALLHQATEAAAIATLDRLGVYTWAGYPLRAALQIAVGRWPELTAARTDPELRLLAEDAEIALVAEIAWAATGARVALDNRARAEALGAGYGPLPPLLYGRDLQRIGVPSGPEMGKLLREVRAAQIQGTVLSPDQALTWVQERLRKTPC